MRLLRAKAGRKSLAFYRVAFGLQSPYRVLLDGTFIQHALKTVKTSIVDRLHKLFGKGDLRLFVARAVVAELEELGEACAEAVNFIGQSCRLVGPRRKNLLPEDAMVELASSDEHHYTVATQDEALKKRLRAIPGVPVIAFSGTVLAIESPSAVSLRAAAKAERDRSRPNEAERDLAKRLGASQKTPKVVLRRTKKRAAAPNPLSCLKKKTAKRGRDEDGTTSVRATTKRRRRRKSAPGPTEPPSEN